jgi:hypothetical protein
LQSSSTIIATAAITTTAQMPSTANPQSAINAITATDLQSSLTTQLSVRQRKLLPAFCRARVCDRFAVCSTRPRFFRPSLIRQCRLELCRQSLPPPLKMPRSHKPCPRSLQQMRPHPRIQRLQRTCNLCCCCCLPRFFFEACGFCHCVFVKHEINLNISRQKTKHFRIMSYRGSGA